ncbi:MAG: hypothetical protein ABR874_22715 [Candidatus Sulfotelmatobacter sp.]|jgi:endonuclease III
MTIDERLDRLTERHEALTQSVELIAQMTRDNARQIADHTRQIGALREAATTLLQIAQIHENRISGLEQGGQ